MAEHIDQERVDQALRDALESDRVPPKLTVEQFDERVDGAIPIPAPHQDDGWKLREERVFAGVIEEVCAAQERDFAILWSRLKHVAVVERERHSGDTEVAGELVIFAHQRDIPLSQVVHIAAL